MNDPLVKLMSSLNFLNSTSDHLDALISNNSIILGRGTIFAFRVKCLRESFFIVRLQAVVARVVSFRIVENFSIWDFDEKGTP